MTARDELRADQGARRNGTDPTRHGAYEVMFDQKGNVVLPEIPSPDDVAGQCAWLTSAFNLDSRHPITGGRRQGLRGPEGHVVLTRAEFPEIRFEPAAKINTPARLIETLSWNTMPTDGAIHALKAEHCRQIAHVVRMLCGVAGNLTAQQEAAGIVGTLMHEAAAAEPNFTTYGTPAQRYEAAIALRRDIDQATGRPTGPRRYLIDINTGEYVIAVSDLQDAARRHTGSSTPRGWLDGRMEALGWARIELQGYGQPGRNGRYGPHARINAYRGLLAAIEGQEQGVNT